MKQLGRRRRKGSQATPAAAHTLSTLAPLYTNLADSPTFNSQIVMIAWKLTDDCHLYNG